MFLSNNMGQQEDNDEATRAGEPMYVSYARQFHDSERQQRADENGPLRRINRAIVYYIGAYCCNLDLQADRPELQDDGKLEDEDIDHYWLCQRAVGRTTRQRAQKSSKTSFGLVQSKWKRQLRLGWIPQLVLACYFAFAAYLLIVLYYQYSYDFDLLRLRKLRKLHHQVAVNNTVTSSWARAIATRQTEIGARMSDTKIVLNLLDPDYSHLSILVECFYLSIVVFVTIIYLSLFVHYRFQRPFDYHMIRDLLDRQRENANIKRLVARQVAKFIGSSRVFRENLINCDTTLLGFQEANLRFAFDDNDDDDNSDVLHQTESSATFRREHQLNQMVREMLASGALTPLYKTSAWLRRRTKLQFAYHMALIVYAIVFDIALTVGFFAQTNPERLGSTRYSLTRMACLGLLMCSGPSVSVHAPIFMVVVQEQLSYLKQLRAMIKRCIRENSQAFARRDDNEPRCSSLGVRVALNQSRSAPNLVARDDEREPKTRVESRSGVGGELTELERTMNSNLIFLILHYKIFIAQLLPIKRSLGFVNVIALALLFTMPIISRIHEPYLSEVNSSGSHLSQAQLKIFTILMSSSILVPANLTSGPLCFMFARCEDLYRDLTSLVAHISEVKSHNADCGSGTGTGTGGGGANIYDSHAESCLLKELSDSKCLLEQLTVRAANISGTYTVLVRAHFWYGLIAISNLVDSNYGRNSEAGGGELLSSLFSDPLGVYSEMK